MSVLELWVEVAIFIAGGITFLSLIFFLRRLSKKNEIHKLTQNDVSEFLTRPIHLDDYRRH